MRKTALCLLCIALLLANCFKEKNDCVARDIVAPAAEQQALADYLTSQNINATKHSSGLYYQVILGGAGLSPAICSSIKVGFSGKLTNGTEVEKDDYMVMNLKLMLEGWRITLPLIKAGGKMKIYLPPTLAYGAEGKKVGATQVVPPNSILIYDITLYEVL
jgi:FKBP-type peptidyl-prolyl cis-trans isomerase FkpA